MSAPTRQEVEAQIAQFLEPWAWETTSYNATMARDDALAKAAQIVEAFPALASQAAQPAEADGVERLREKMDSPAPTIGEGEYAYAKVEQLPKMLRDQCCDVLFFEAEPHVIADAWNIVRMAANALEALAATPKAPTLTAGEVDPIAWLYEKNGRQSLQPVRQPWNAAPDRGWTETALYAATPPAPNDDLRAALEQIELLASNHGGWVDTDARKCVADMGQIASAALKENRRG